MSCIKPIKKIINISLIFIISNMFCIKICDPISYSNDSSKFFLKIEIKHQTK